MGGVLNAQVSGGFGLRAVAVAEDPIEAAVAGLRAADRAMATVLRAVAEAGPRDGLSVRRQVALRAEVTGVDVGFLERAVQTLSAMPRVWAAFDAGRLSWSQLRGVVCEARRLPAAQRAVLDDGLAGLIEAGVGEPDRIVEAAGDLVARLDPSELERAEEAQERAQRVVLQMDFDGWTEIHGLLGPEIGATVGEALDAAADAPMSAADPRPTDEDGREVSAPVRPVASRAAQWADALGRVCATYLAGGPDGSSTRARPRLLLVASLNDVLDRDPSEGYAVSRLLLRRGSGRRRVSRALVRSLADDAEIVPVFTDDDGLPVLIGDAYSPITEPLRRAVIARDQGCRAPACSAPAAHCDVHHVVPPPPPPGDPPSTADPLPRPDDVTHPALPF